MKKVFCGSMALMIIVLAGLQTLNVMRGRAHLCRIAKLQYELGGTSNNPLILGGCDMMGFS